MINQRLDSERVCALVAMYEQKDVYTGRALGDIDMGIDGEMEQ